MKIKGKRNSKVVFVPESNYDAFNLGRIFKESIIMLMLTDDGLDFVSLEAETDDVVKLLLKSRGLK